MVFLMGTRSEDTYLGTDPVSGDDDMRDERSRLRHQWHQVGQRREPSSLATRWGGEDEIQDDAVVSRHQHASVSPGDTTVFTDDGLHGIECLVPGTLALQLLARGAPTQLDLMGGVLRRAAGIEVGGGEWPGGVVHRRKPAEIHARRLPQRGKVMRLSTAHYPATVSAGERRVAPRV